MNVVKTLEFYYFVIISSRNLHSEMGKPNNELHCQCVCCCYYPVADWKINTRNTEAFKNKKSSKHMAEYFKPLFVFV